MLDLEELAGVIGERSILPAVTHELRAPLSSIRGYLETLLDGDCDPHTSRRFLEAAHREALRLSRLIDGLLEFSAFDIAPQPSLTCDVVTQIGATIDIVAPMARKRNVTITTRLPKTAVAAVDSEACIHAVCNLVENAIKHGHRDGTVSVTCRPRDGFVEVTVEDDGDGIHPSERAAIFGLGVRGAGADRNGSGIGLAIVKAVAECASGDVRVDASVLGGACFVLRFRAVPIGEGIV